MKIRSVKSYRHAFELTRPYTIAYKTQTTAENVIVEIQTDDGKIGLGAGSPAKEVTQESMEMCIQALNSCEQRWVGREVSDLPLLKREVYSKLVESPAACAAVDIALHDLYAQALNKPLVDVLGRVHHQLATSITIGIKNVEETLVEAQEYFLRGFRVLKVKLGCDLAEDIERLVKLRERYGSEMTIRVDPNQGYTLSELITFFDKTKNVDIEFIEQPIKVTKVQELHELSVEQKKHIALDESMLSPKDAIRLLMPTPCCGIYNIKLMKCGGIHAAQQIATIAEAADLKLMWGCMDESIISITAALHAAFSSPATQYIDLDGSLDLAQDIVTGGFNLKNGIMSVLDLPGLGVRKV